MENDAAYGRPDLEMVPEVSEASLTMAGRLGRRRVISFPASAGPFTCARPVRSPVSRVC